MRIFYNAAALAALAAFIVAVPTMAQNAPVPPRSATFGCDAPVGHSCNFTVFGTDGSKRAFGMAAGSRYLVSVRPGQDVYVVVVDHEPVATADGCPAVGAAGKFCKRAITSAGFNN